MSAKCKYSSKFWPLVSQMQANLDRDAFRAFLLESFIDGEQVFSDLSGGVSFNTSTNPIFNPKQIDTKTDLISTEDNATVRSHYVGHVTEYNRMLRRFKTDIISKSVFDRTTYDSKTKKSGSFIDANAVSDNGQTFLNKNLGEHKVELINILREYAGLDPVRYRKDLTYMTFTSWINDALSSFSTTVNGTNVTRDSKFQGALDAYVVLKNYDKLIKEYTPFIEVKPEYANSPYQGVNMYTYKGPNVQHFTGWGSNKDVDISKQTSDLATILLDYFPELNEQYEPVDGTSITVTGFNSAMTSVKAAVLYNNSPYLNSVRDEVFKGAKADMTSIIDAYLNFLSKADDYTDHVSYLHSKLRAIKKFIYESDLHPDLKNTFTAMFTKTVPVSYRAYYQDAEAGIMSKSLKEQFTNVQSFRFNDVVRASVYNFQNNKDAFQELIDKYNIKIADGLITFSQITLGDVEKKFSIKYDWKASKGEAAKYAFSTVGTIDNDSSLQNIVYDVLSYIVPDDFESVGSQVMGNKWRGAMNSFAPLIGITLLAANGDAGFDTDSYGLVKMAPYTYDIREAARIASVIFGSDTLNVIKNLEGNNLPLYQLNTLAYNYLQLTNDIKQVDDSIYSGNFLLNSDLVKPPVVRSEIGFNKKIKKPADLTVSEVLRTSIIYDFYQNISRDARSTDNGVIYLQNTTFADKNTHYLIPYDIKKNVRYREKDYNLQTILSNAVRTGNTSELEEIFFESRKSKITNLVNNLLRDYSLAFETEFTSLDEINKYIVDNQLSVDKIQKRFTDKGINLYENIHYYKPRVKGMKFPQINETIYNWSNVFTDKEATSKRIDNERRKFARNLIENGFQLNVSDDAVIKDMADKTGSDWVSRDNVVLVKVFDKNGKPVPIKRDGSTLMNSDYKVVLNPVLQSYFMTDILLSNEYNSLMIGEVYAHANKNSEGSNPEEYAEFSEANRLIAQYKRAVILGATHHPFLQGLDNGVSENINIAVISDIEAEVLNMIGDLKGDLEAMDGSGFSSPHQSIFENNSLLDARVGEDKKTIMHSMDASYGRPTLLKWAVYNFNNMRRQLSQGSDISIEQLFKKMHSIPLNKEFDVKKYWKDYNQDIYFKDYRDGNYYKITDITAFVDEEDGVFKVVRETKQVDLHTGEDLSPRVHVDTFVATTIYELDQIFGGSFSMQLDSEYGRLINANHNLDLVNKIIIGEDFKDKFIAYLVNKSAIKVGAGNINSSKLFNSGNNDALMTISMSTKYGGVQMDADHDLDYAKVTEMTQMLSALEQNGYTHDLANTIYKDIGAVVTESMQKFNQAIQEGDRNKVYTLLGKALVESFSTGDKDTLGLAQAFVALASKNLQQNSLEYKLPFSASTINGAFIATVTSMLVKKGIRRKYDGVAAVLTPSYGMVQYYNYEGSNYTFNEMADMILSHVQNDYDEYGDITRSAWEKALNDEIIDGQANPFIRLVQNRNEIEQEDYIIVRDRATGQTVPELSGKVDTFEKYDRVKNLLENDQYSFWNWTIKPKNLKGSDTKFDLMVPGLNGILTRKTFSIYDTDSVRASLYMNKSNRTDYENALIERAYGEPIEGVSAQKIKSALRAKTQIMLERLDKGMEIPVSVAFGVAEDGFITPVSGSVNVEPAQIIMGKLNAVKFGLQQGDSISQIENYISPTDLDGRPLYSNFFHERLQTNYQMPDVDKSLYDVVLFTGTGSNVLVKIATKTEVNRDLQDFHLTKNDNFSIIEGDVYYKDTLFTTTEQKQFYTYTDDAGEQHDIIVINDISELEDIRNSKLFDTYRYNYTQSNWQKLISIIYSRELENQKLIFLPFKDSRGLTQYKPLDINNPESFETLSEAESISFDERLRRSSEHKLESFKKQLLYIGARIPSQSMQSFMPMKVVAFTDSEIADVYVTKYNTWLEGSDYDIDKLYIMGYAIDDNGHFQTLSNLQNDFSIDDIQKLPKPNGVRYHEGEDGTFITLEKLQQIVGTFEYIEGVASTRSSIDPFIEVIQSGNSLVNFEEPAPVMMGDKLNRPMTEQANREFQRKKNEFLKLLNRHTTTKLGTFAQENALKNQVVTGIFDVLLNTKNQINLHIPIDMKEQQDAAKKSALGDAEKHMSSDNPATKYIMQVQNMVGKQVIGAVAVSLKVFFGVTNYYNSEFENLINLVDNYKNNEIVDVLNRLVFTNPETNGLGIIANVNLEPIISHLQEIGINEIAFAPQVEINEVMRKYVNNGNLRLLDLLIDLATISGKVDSALSISGLLSAATDNAKELILAKINAGSKFVDIYTYLMSVGSSFDSIADIMTSPIFNEVSKLVDTNIFDMSTYGFNLKAAIDFYLNKSTLPFLKKEIFDEVSISLMQEDGFALTEYTSDPEQMKKFRNAIFEKLKTLKEAKAVAGEFIDHEQMALEPDPEHEGPGYDLEVMENGEDFGVDGNSFKYEKRDFTVNPVKAFEYVQVLRFLDYVQDRNEVLKTLNEQGGTKMPNSDKLFPMLNTQIGYLTLLSEKVIPATEEMRILGRMLGINQGIRTNNYEKYSYITSIESFVNRRINEYNNAETTVQPFFVTDGTGNQTYSFELMKFLNDPVYRSSMISRYEDLKSTYNILDIITKVPHFSAMFNILAIDDYMLKDYAVRGTLERKVSKEIVANDFTTLNQPEFREMSRYINDTLIVNWLFNANLDIEVPVGQKYYTGFMDEAVTNSIEGTVVPLNSLAGLASFKSIMEESIIPQMKKDPEFADNTFIKSLSKSVVTDPKTKGIKIYSRLPLNMMQIDASQKTQIIYERILEGFNSIANKEVNGWRVADLFYLYNLVTHKDSFGINALTRIFEDLATSGDTSLMVNQYNQWLSDVDFDENKESIQYDLKDLKFRLAGFPSSYNKFGSKLTKEKVEIVIQNGSSSYVEAYDVKRYDPSDFTFNMQFLENQAPSIVKENVKPIEPTDDSYYKGAPSTQEAVIALTDRLFKAYNGSVEMITDRDVRDNPNPLVRNAKAYIDNGTVYINVDKADISTPLHEFSHLVMAGLKATNPDIYYHLLSIITEHEHFEQVANLPIHSSLHGSDLKEEVLIKLMETYFNNNTYGKDFTTEFSSVEGLVKSAIGFVFDIDVSDTDLHDLMATNTDNVLKAFGSGLFNYDFASIVDMNAIQLSQRLATLKDQAIRNNLINEDCE